MRLQDAIEAALGETVRLGNSVTGGCINHALRGQTGAGATIFIKTNEQAPPALFPAEAAGLQALDSAPGGCRVPKVLAVSPAFLVLEWIESGPSGPRVGESLGRGLAAQHRVTQRTYGFRAGDNYIGSTPQPNPLIEDWVTFFAEQRLHFQHALLRGQGRSSPELDRALDQLLPRLATWLRLPSERPALLHGDLWGGNTLADAQGHGVLIDPAVYFGCREADLAMTELFGGFRPEFYAAYREVFPLEPGYEHRRDLYNLYHVLNHANLFGGSYTQQAERMLRPYV